MVKQTPITDLLAAGLTATSMRGKTIANNIANMSTDGYRRYDVQFEQLLANELKSSGGVDMDKLCRLPIDQLRAYCRSVLDACMPSGRYCYGSGNTIANYVPIENYFAMIEEGFRYGR